MTTGVVEVTLSKNKVYDAARELNHELGEGQSVAITAKVSPTYMTTFSKNPICTS